VANMKMAGAAVFGIRVRVAALGACLLAIRVSGVVGGVTVSGQMQDVLDGFASTRAQHEGCNRKHDDQNPLHHELRVFGNSNGVSSVKGSRARLVCRDPGRGGGRFR